jgi:hypothetical protein
LFHRYGALVSDDDAAGLLSALRDVKEKFLNNPDVPVKWNLKDLDRALGLHGVAALREALLSQANEVRAGLIVAICGSGCRLFLSVFRAHSQLKGSLSEGRSAFLGYSFSNLLMRAGLCCRDLSAFPVQVVLDWPAKEQRDPFVKEYLLGWRNGVSGKGPGAIKYLCGPLRDHRFEPGLLFGVTDADPILQAVNLVVGSGRAFVRFALGDVPEADFGVTCFRQLLSRFHRSGFGRVLDYGIAVSPKGGSLYRNLEKVLGE